MKKAILALADGTVFHGRALGFEGETVGEVVFNTAMTGYQEILSDPSYKGQIVAMTCSHIGNYGVTRQDDESRRLWTEGFVVREASRRSSNWRAEETLHEYLTSARVVGIEGVDTRAVTRHLRDRGTQPGIISQIDLDPRRVVDKARHAPSIVGRDLVSEVTCGERYTWTAGTGAWTPCALTRQTDDGTAVKDSRREERVSRVVVYDFGVKQNILRRLIDVGCAITVVPASTPAERVLAMAPDGIVLSNGPGDPEAGASASVPPSSLGGNRGTAPLPAPVPVSERVLFPVPEPLEPPEPLASSKWFPDRFPSSLSGTASWTT